MGISCELEADRGMDAARHFPRFFSFFQPYFLGQGLVSVGFGVGLARGTEVRLAVGSAGRIAMAQTVRWPTAREKRRHSPPRASPQARIERAFSPQNRLPELA